MTRDEQYKSEMKTLRSASAPDVSLADMSVQKWEHPQHAASWLNYILLLKGVYGKKKKYNSISF